MTKLCIINMSICIDIVIEEDAFWIHEAWPIYHVLCNINVFHISEREDIEIVADAGIHEGCIHLSILLYQYDDGHQININRPLNKRKINGYKEI